MSKKKKQVNMFDELIPKCKKAQKEITKKFGKEIYDRCIKGNVFALKSVMPLLKG